MNINKIHVDRAYKHMVESYKDGRMPRMKEASNVCFTILCA